MGNTPSHQDGSPQKPSNQHTASSAAPGPGPTNPSSSTQSSPAASSTRHHPNLRLPMPSRPTHISPQSSHPTSPSGNVRNTSGSPRRRKSLELPDLNKLSFTPAAPVATTATTTNHHHHLLNTSASSSSKPSSAGPSPGGRKWQHVLGGRASPLAGANALGAMSKMAPAGEPKPTPVKVPEVTLSPSKGATGAADTINPYFPSSPSRGAKATVISASAPATASVPATPPREPESRADDGLVDVPVHWTQGGKVVYVSGTFADNWRTRFKLKRSTHDFNTMLHLPPGQYKLKFIVDESWRTAKHIPTATDDDGTLVNWIEVEQPKTEEEARAEWEMDSKPATKHGDEDDSQWTNVIPAPLVAYQYIEELPTHTDEATYNAFIHSVPHVSMVPQPPTLPRILDKVIVNAEPPRRKNEEVSGPPGMLDDNSILAVPNHVVLNHLTASAIKNGTLGVGTTTRYRKKYITTMFFKPTLGDLMGDAPQSEVANSQSG